MSCRCRLIAESTSQFFLTIFVCDDYFIVLSSLVRLHKNVSKSLARLAPFIFQEWFFDNKRTLELHESLNATDKETFGLDIRPIQWNDYFENMHAGVRRYLNNEELKTLPAAKKKNRM